MTTLRTLYERQTATRPSVIVPSPVNQPTHSATCPWCQIGRRLRGWPPSIKLPKHLSRHPSPEYLMDATFTQCVAVLAILLAPDSGGESGNQTDLAYADRGGYAEGTQSAPVSGDEAVSVVGLMYESATGLGGTEPRGPKAYLIFPHTAGDVSLEIREKRPVHNYLLDRVDKKQIQTGPGYSAFEWPTVNLRRYKDPPLRISDLVALVKTTPQVEGEAGGEGRELFVPCVLNAANEMPDIARLRFWLRAHRNCKVRCDLLKDGNAVTEVQHHVSRRNRPVAFSWDTTALQPGEYTIRYIINVGTEDEPPIELRFQYYEPADR